VAGLKLTAAVLSIVLMTAGFGLALRAAPASQPLRRPDPAADAVATAPNPSTAVDRHGDPLPKYARARMGTNRFHNGSLVNQVLFTPDAKSLITVDHTPVVRVWDATTGRVLREIGDSPADFPEVTPSRRIALSPEGKRWQRSITPAGSGSGTWPRAPAVAPVPGPAVRAPELLPRWPDRGRDRRTIRSSRPDVSVVQLPRSCHR